MLSRPWDADDYLREINECFITRSKSIAKLLDSTPVAAELFANNQQRCLQQVPTSSAIRDFSYAPQRFASEAKVLCRLVLHFDAAMSTAAQLVDLRDPTSAEGAACIATLDFATAEVMLQLTLLADAAMQTFDLVRECNRLSVFPS